MLTKHKNLSKSKRREIKKKEYNKFKRVLKNNLSREDRSTYGTVTLSQFNKMKLRLMNLKRREKEKLKKELNTKN